jgi:signal transduction histidine kinase
VQVSANDGGIDISIDDNGSGYPFAGAFSLDELDLLRIGPGTVKRRVRALNGEMTVESSPGRGSSLRLRIPQ